MNDPRSKPGKAAGKHAKGEKPRKELPHTRGHKHQESTDHRLTPVSQAMLCKDPSLSAPCPDKALRPEETEVCEMQQTQPWGVPFIHVLMSASQSELLLLHRVHRLGDRNALPPKCPRK